ncbi:D-beta-hydroxybutyrate dehydrogenase, mitochondrial [Leptidea sinapis]|uniref:D-beta-hydroxybutyrate dehydrogenase, mitochondrial n=1 Tax=Leptidea sinapis TaxID=189913 RepID=UPI0021345706|nr:D-beta-hydroxybutyrate dehydrogenase, mitochondrial [Leptidea sinapis]
MITFKRVVAITGCDSGLGWALAARMSREGLITVAGMYNGTDTEAARALRSLSVHPHQLDVTNPRSIANFHEYIKDLLSKNPDYKLYALVNNAGVMTIADFEVQTPKIIEETININLLGPMQMASVFLPELRRNAIEGVVHPRIINVSSHCGMHPLPGFGPYSASKAGLLAWTEALRLEFSNTGLGVTAFIPGGFVGSSNIMVTQTRNVRQILDALSEEQKSYYEAKIRTLNNYLCRGSEKENSYDALKDENIIETFMKALLDDRPKILYKVEPWRYTFYYSLFKIPLPEFIYLWIINKFLCFPK